ncbi:Sigma 54-dependent transcriptional activator [Oleispira antarctica RB-8]|uniref:Sigma 54-dependent transcriptional activator n=1 Tax=Oleispira antarctica RB-8 TaxID=698738 RepID=R4YUG5_OLEAN|nr:Sigma 54-dependent transcriptional activator [Oleispira antarctica RB-8]
MKEYVLTAWIGGADVDDLPKRKGRLFSTLAKGDYSHAYLMYNYKKHVKDVPSYLQELQILFPEVSIDAAHVPLTSPQDMSEIYQSANALLGQVVADHPGAALYIQITPGTPAMQAVWILLGKTSYPQVTFLQSGPDQEVYETEIPFEISAEYTRSGQKLSDFNFSEVPIHAAFDDIITSNTHMNTLKQRASVLAQHEVPVLINGASGTGKELFATAIHNASARSDELLKVVNCGAIPPELIDSTLFGHKKGAFTGAVSDQPGVFEVADGGTLFLDEFGELPLDAQVRLLRVLQEGTLSRVGDSKVLKVNVRIICATNKNLVKAIGEGKFREDLFYRIAVGVINLPPIKERSGDLSILAASLLENIQSQLGLDKDKKLSPGATNIILSHSWPGNVRELHSTLLRACLWSQNKNIGEADLRDAMFTQSTDSNDIMSHDLSQSIDLKGLQDQLEEHYVRLAWLKTDGQKKKAAALLGIKNYQSYDKRLKDYNIS